MPIGKMWFENQEMQTELSVDFKSQIHELNRQ